MGYRLQLSKSNVHGYPSREDHFQLIVEGSLTVNRELASNSRRYGMRCHQSFHDHRSSSRCEAFGRLKLT